MKNLKKSLGLFSFLAFSCFSLPSFAQENFQKEKDVFLSSVVDLSSLKISKASDLSENEIQLENVLKTPKYLKLESPVNSDILLSDMRQASDFLKDDFVLDEVYLIVDRNPKVQRLFITIPRSKNWLVLGTFKVSTGKPGRKDHYETPIGVYKLDGSILGYRAQGTKNENGIRGIGRKGMRVWDFGWVDTKDWRTHSKTLTQIRMEMHATDPDILEQRLGRPDSEGCIRIPSQLNVFLDTYGLLDKDVKIMSQTSRSRKALLSPFLVLTPLSGDKVVIVDSSL